MSRAETLALAIGLILLGVAAANAAGPPSAPYLAKAPSAGAMILTGMAPLRGRAIPVHINPMGRLRRP